MKHGVAKLVLAIQNRLCKEALPLKNIAFQQVLGFFLDPFDEVSSR